MHKVAKQVTNFVLIVSLASALAACNRGASGGTNAGDAAVAATVNGKNILLSEVDRIISQQAGGQQSRMSPLELAAARLQVLEGLIQQQVLFQRAEKESLLPKEEEITQIINQQKQQGRLTEEEYQKMLKDSGQTEQSLREETRKTIAIQKLQEKTAGSIPSISDKEVEDFYNNNKQEFVSRRGAALSAIVVDPSDNGLQDDAKTEAEAIAKINRLHSQLKSGADFATVARASSEDPSNVRGGDVGFASEEQLKQTGFPEELVGRLFGPMQVGDITEPVRSGNGRWYVFKLTRRQLQNENLTLDSPGVRDQIKEGLINQRRTLLNAALVATAMNEAKVVNNLALTMLKDPNSLRALSPVAGGAASPAATAASPAASATPPAQTAASPTPSPASSPETKK